MRNPKCSSAPARTYRARSVQREQPTVLRAREWRQNGVTNRLPPEINEERL
jgi:hypothetical protein